MAQEVQLEAGTLPPPACYATEQERFEAYVAAITATITGGIQWQVGETPPITLTDYWLKTDNNIGPDLIGRPIGGYKYSSADGVWLPWFREMIYGLDAGAADTYAMNPAPALTAVTAYRVGMMYTFIANNANTGTVGATFQVSGIAGPKAIKKNVTDALAAGDIKAGQAVTLIYDGTNFQMISKTSESVARGSMFDQTPGIGKSWVCPANVTSVEVSLTGGGGGGNQDAGTVGGGGGGFSYKRWAVTAGTTYHYDVGVAGAKATASGNDASGGNSRFNTDDGTPQVAVGGTKASGGGAGGTFSGSDWGINGTSGNRQCGSDRFMGGQSAFPGSQFGWSFTNIVGGIDGVLGGGGATDTDATSKDASSGGTGAILIKW